ncbi:MAG: hypothetical protein HY089_08500, partial [Ignavibacteriales bacterium]|nr:hypothetical protein [Ignavibacteriales bacterium]
MSIEGSGNVVFLRGPLGEGKVITASHVQQGIFQGGGTLWLVYDPSRGQSSGLGDTVRVRVDGGGKSAEMFVTLQCAQTLNSFRLTTDKDTVAHGASTRITAIAMDVSNHEMPLDGTTQVTLWLGTGFEETEIRETDMPSSPHVRSEKIALESSLRIKRGDRAAMAYRGSFIVGSDTIADEVTVPYALARSGSITYVANGAEPLGSDPVP